ncbi:MAG: SBBP repeat-containing protein, partial [Candidatus Kariarchaeaceae archaeon]
MPKKKSCYFLIILMMNIFLLSLNSKFSVNSVDIGDLNFSTSSDGAPIQEEWYRTWGGADEEVGVNSATDKAGNIYIVGTTYESGMTGEEQMDMMLLKYDSSGLLIWSRIWDENQYDVGYAIALDSSDNIYLAGGTGRPDYVFDMVLVKYDSSGVLQWSRTWDEGGIDIGLAITLDFSGNIYLAGNSFSQGSEGQHVVLVKYDSSGALQWSRHWIAGGDDRCYAIGVDLSGNVYLTGETTEQDQMADIFLVKYNSLGGLQWTRNWGGNEYDTGYEIVLDTAGNIYIGGYTESYGAGGPDMVLVKYDSSGVFQWYETWGGTNWDIGQGLALDSSGNIYLGGYTESYGAGETDMVLVKYDSSGTFQWYETWGGSMQDHCFTIALDSIGNIYLAGSTGWTVGIGNRDL